MGASGIAKQEWDGSAGQKMTEAEKCPSFIAMEYYGLILNRTFEIHACYDGLAGIKVAGVIAALPQYTQSEYQDPKAFVSRQSQKKYSGIEVCSNEVLKVDSSNFKLPFDDIASVEFIAKKKWGMGPVPHTGVLNIKLRTTNKKREFILLGNQDGVAIANELVRKIQN